MRKGVLLLAAVVFAATVSSQTANAASDTSNKNSSNVTSSASAGPKEDAARYGLDMLDQIHKARTAINNKNKQAALQHVQTATYDLAKARKEALSNYIPLYEEFASVSVVAPVQAEQKQHAPQSGNSSSNTVPAAVNQVVGGYSIMEFDSSGALSHLDAAKNALDNGDWNAADNDLAAVQDSVVFGTYESDLPLVRAQENLIFARNNAQKGNWKEVHAALTSAANALGNYEQSGGSHVNDAKNLQQQIQDYSQHVTQNHSDAISKINQWWNTASAWLQTPKNNNA